MNNTIKHKTECYRKAVNQVIVNHDGPARAVLLVSIEQVFRERVLA